MKYTWIHDSPGPTPTMGEHTAEHLCPYCQLSIVGTRAAMEHILECCDRWRRGYRLTTEPIRLSDVEHLGSVAPAPAPFLVLGGDGLIGSGRRARFPNLSVDE